MSLIVLNGCGLCADARHVRTVKEPIQPIPTFEELIDLLMEVSSLSAGWESANIQPENQHVVLNVRIS